MNRSGMVSWSALVLFMLLSLSTHAHPSAASASSNNQQNGPGDISAVYDLLDRVLAPNRNSQNLPSSHFVLKLCDTDEKEEPPPLTNSTSCSCSNSNASSSNDAAWFCMDQEKRTLDGDDNRIFIVGTSVSELSYGIGYYFRYYCNFALGWDRIGGSVRNLTLPAEWPSLPYPIQKHRRVPWSYLLNVCTHSYSLVWHDWDSSTHGWGAFLDWASLMGINNLLALTGQEEIQYKVYQKLGLKDKDIRSWFNGPAFLTWSRGQNEYGSNIAGPLPRSWMQQQWALQKEHILPRLHELSIVGQLPGFQGNVPIQLADLFPSSKMTKMDDTGWLDALDPLYAKIADLWMETMMQDFGADVISHWYQMDGYFNGGVPPWLGSPLAVSETSNIDDTSHATVSATRRLDGIVEDNNMMHGTPKNVPRDEVWYERGVAAYTGLNRTDPDAIWSFQGFSFIGWNNSDITASWLKGFVESAPPGRFVIIDMAYSGLGEWTKWNNASYFGADFIWSALHNFGDTNGLKGDLNRIASILPTTRDATPSMVGIGATPEGIDQNPVYYEFLLDQAFALTRDPTVPDVTSVLVERSLRRYGGLSIEDPAGDNAAKGWQSLAKSSYATDQSVQDNTGVAHMTPRGGDASSQFETNRYTPKPMICHIYGAWRHFIRAATVASESQSGFREAPFTYDLINTGREVLAQLSTPMALNFSDALAEVPLDTGRLLQTGNAYIQLLKNLDLLVGAHSAFLVGPWIESARGWGVQWDDCHADSIPGIKDCPHFYEWNARVQVTTWNPTMPNTSTIPGGPIDYAAKHWNGIVGEYYAERASLVMKQSLADAGETGTLNATEVSRLKARHAYQWTTAQKKYPSQAIGDPLQLSEAMERVYQQEFSGCWASVGI